MEKNHRDAKIPCSPYHSFIAVGAACIKQKKGARCFLRPRAIRRKPSTRRLSRVVLSIAFCTAVVVEASRGSSAAAFMVIECFFVLVHCVNALLLDLV